MLDMRRTCLHYSRAELPWVVLLLLALAREQGLHCTVLFMDKGRGCPCHLICPEFIRLGISRPVKLSTMARPEHANVMVNAVQ